jgi:hypothetical protein
LTASGKATRRPVDQHAHALRRPRVEQQHLAGRTRAHRRQALAAFGENFAEALRQHHPAAGRLVEPQQIAVVVVVECGTRVDRPNVDAVAEDAVAGGIGAGRDRRGIDPGHGREDGVAVEKVDALLPQPPQVGRLLRRNRVRPQPVDHQDQIEDGASGGGGLRRAGNDDQREGCLRDADRGRRESGAHSSHGFPHREFLAQLDCAADDSIRRRMHIYGAQTE